MKDSTLRERIQALIDQPGTCDEARALLNAALAHADVPKTLPVVTLSPAAPPVEASGNAPAGSNSQPAPDRWEHTRPAFEAQTDYSDRKQSGVYLSPPMQHAWLGWQACLDWQAAQQAPKRTGKRYASVREMVDDTLEPAEAEKLKAMMDASDEQQPDPPRQSAREWVEARIRSAEETPGYPWVHGFVTLQLADRCDAAEARCSQWADIAGEHGAECDSLRAQLTAAQARITALNVEVNTISSLLMDERRDKDAAQAEAGRLRDAIQWALGETTEGFPVREDGEGPYWWRRELRARAALAGKEEAQ